MKTTKYTFASPKKWWASILLLSFVFFTSTFAQVEEKPEAKVDEETEVNKPNSQRNSRNHQDKTDGIQAVNDQIIISNESNVPILHIIEESNSAASILFYDKSNFSGPFKKLANIGGDLYWGSDQLGVAGSAGGWTDAGSQIYNSTLTDRVGIGTNNPSSKLSVGGNGSSLYSIFGSNSATSGVGIYGSGSGSFGTGVQGFSSAADGKGIVGYTTGYSGRAVYGESSTTSQFDKNYGGYFKATGKYGIGVYAEVIGTNGTGIIGKASSPQSFAAEFYNTGDNSTSVYIENPAPNGTALLASGTRAALFGGEVQIAGSLKIEGEVTIGSSGAPFLEIREITGTNGNGVAPQLPVGWTGAKTRLLSLEMKYGTSDEWVSLGFYIDDCSLAIFDGNHGERAVSVVFTEPNGRGLRILYPRCGDSDIFDHSPWRAVIMRMP